METKEPIVIESVIKAPLGKVWEYYNEPEHITHWAFASDDWEAPSVENDLRTGGKFKTRMQAKDGSMGFDFGGTYTNVVERSLIEYDMTEGGRHVKTEFIEIPDGVRIIIAFDPESENPLEMQKNGWQAILDNFKKYVEQ